MTEEFAKGLREFTKEARELYFKKHYHPSHLAEDNPYKKIIAELNYHDRCVEEMMSGDLEE